MGLSYSRLMNGLKKANIQVDRKILADLALNDAGAFARLAETAQQALQIICILSHAVTMLSCFIEWMLKVI